MASQTDRPGSSQTPHNRGPAYASVELLPQGVVASVSAWQRGAPILIMNTNPQRPRYGTGTTAISDPSVQVLLPGQGPIDRGY